jgi:hypothetical protein
MSYQKLLEMGRISKKNVLRQPELLRVNPSHRIYHDLFSLTQPRGLFLWYSVLTRFRLSERLI